jgi:hypothetical protein
MTAPWVAERRADVVACATTWGGSDDLRALVSALGGPATATLRELAKWSAATLDTRKGAERRDMAPVELSDAHVRALLTAAGPLGLLETASPQERAYDATLLLGGATTGNRLRSKLAARLSADGVDLGLLALVSSDRPIGAREHESDPDSQQDATEWQHLLRAVAAELGPLERVACEEEFHAPGVRRVRLLVAPGAAPNTRATTADGIRYFLEHVVVPSVLLVTSAIYAPYQFFAVAPLLLDGGCSRVELVGTPTATDGDQPSLAQRVAQEIHAALTAAAALAEAGT